MSLLDKLTKNSTVKLTSTLANSKVYGKKDMVPTQVPMVNVALSGRVDGGLTPGLTVLAGPSKHLKQHSHYLWQVLISISMKMVLYCFTTQSLAHHRTTSSLLVLI